MPSAITNPNIKIRNQSQSGLTFSAGVTPKAVGMNGPTTTTAPSAGGGGALPATPAGYLTVNVGGTDRKVAYY